MAEPRRSRRRSLDATSFPRLSIGSHQLSQRFEGPGTLALHGPLGQTQGFGGLPDGQIAVEAENDDGPSSRWQLTYQREDVGAIVDAVGRGLRRGTFWHRGDIGAFP